MNLGVEDTGGQNTWRLDTCDRCKILKMLAMHLLDTFLWLDIPIGLLLGIAKSHGADGRQRL